VLLSVIVAFVTLSCCFSPCSWLLACCFLLCYNFCLEKSISNYVPSLTLYGLFSICFFFCFLKRKKTQIHHFIKKLEKAYSGYFCLGISVLVSSSLFKWWKMCEATEKDGSDKQSGSLCCFHLVAVIVLEKTKCFSEKRRGLLYNCQ